MVRILFVCHGNICRSTMAQFVFQDMVNKAGLADSFYIDSAATSREEIGNPPHHGTRRKLRHEGIPCGEHRARQMRAEEYDKFDYIIGMDSWNIRNIMRILGNGDPDAKVSKLLDFTDKYVMLDGFLLDDIIIEKGFVEELVSAVDYSQITAVAEDISSYESESACVTDESLTSFPDIRKWNTEAVLTTPIVRYGSGEGAVSRLANAYKNILQKAMDGGYHTLSIAPLSDFPLNIEGEIANQSTDIFFSLHPESPMCITFVLPDEDSLSRFLMPPEHQQE